MCNCPSIHTISEFTSDMTIHLSIYPSRNIILIFLCANVFIVFLWFSTNGVCRIVHILPHWGNSVNISCKKKNNFFMQIIPNFIFFFLSFFYRSFCMLLPPQIKSSWETLVSAVVAFNVFQN